MLTNCTYILGYVQDEQINTCMHIVEDMWQTKKRDNIVEMWILIPIISMADGCFDCWHGGGKMMNEIRHSFQRGQQAAVFPETWFWEHFYSMQGELKQLRNMIDPTARWGEWWHFSRELAHQEETKSQCCLLWFLMWIKVIFIQTGYKSFKNWRYSHSTVQSSPFVTLLPHTSFEFAGWRSVFFWRKYNRRRHALTLSID